MKRRSLSTFSRRSSNCLVLAGCLMLTGCMGMLGPDDNAPPPPDLSRDQGLLARFDMHLLYHPCRGWPGAEPPESMLLADIAFIRAGPDAPPDMPTGENIRLLLRAGARLVHEYHLNLVRAWLPKSHVPALSRDESIMSIFRVDDPTRFDWRVGIALPFGSPLNEAVDRFVKLGGLVTRRFDAASVFLGVIPDATLPALRAAVPSAEVQASLVSPDCKISA